MKYIEMGKKLGEKYSSRELVKIMAYLKFQTPKNAIEYILELAELCDVKIFGDLINEDNLTSFILGFHNGTIQVGTCNPNDAKLM
ncbi:hypothetical protein [uncultured Clostridium sp.]|jgi:hypothetical protein|uniref:hypothetical protein n=1 Tax=uncultured Clostridium sp. TaxID=59620 RepID=UPI0026031205|nr:hypothetical protein [uncultured Clostridium sp.]